MCEDRRRGPDRAAGRLGRRHDLRASRRRDQRDHGGPPPPPGQDPLRPRAPRGGGRLHGHRLRQVDRPARGVPGHLGPGRHPPAERPLRRQARPRPGAGHHRHAGVPDARHRLPAGGGPREAVHGRGRVQPDDPRAGPGADARRPGRPPRPGPPDASSHLTIPTDIQIADADANPWDAPAPAVIKPTAPIFLARPGVPRDARPATRPPTCSTRAARSSCWSAPARSARPRRGPARSPSCSAARSSRRCRARRSCPTTIRSPSAASACSAPRRPRTRWRTATPCSWSAPTSRTPSTCPSRARPRSSRSRPTRSGPATASPPMCPLVGDAKEALAALLPLLDRKAGPRVPRGRPDRHGGLARADGERSRRSTADPIQPQHLMRVDRPAGRRRRHPDLGLGHHRHLGGPALRRSGATASSTSPATSPRWRPGLPYTIANQWAHPGPPVHRLRRRRRASPC